MKPTRKVMSTHHRCLLPSGHDIPVDGEKMRGQVRGKGKQTRDKEKGGRCNRRSKGEQIGGRESKIGIIGRE